MSDEHDDDHIEEDIEGTICERCHNGYTLRPNCEPTGLCDPCAQEVAAPIWARQKMLKAVRAGAVAFGGDTKVVGLEAQAAVIEDAIWEFHGGKRGWFSWDRATVRTMGSKSLDVSEELAAFLSVRFGVAVEPDTPLWTVAKMVHAKGTPS